MNDDSTMRTITIVLHFANENKPEWIWENHKNQTYQYEVLISAIAEGDLIRISENE